MCSSGSRASVLGAEGRWGGTNHTDHQNNKKLYREYIVKYILSQEEFDDLKNSKVNLITLETKKLQDLCTKIADTMPIDAGWRSVEPAPWGCILSKKYEWYCDKCPVCDICPNTFKEYSK